MIYDKIKNTIKITLPFVFAIILFYFAFKGIELNNLIHNISKISLLYFILLIIFTILSHLIRAYRLKIILQSHKDIDVHILFKSLLIGYAFNAVIPRSGEITRAIVTGIDTNTPKSYVLGSILLERVFDMIFFIVSILIASLVLGDKLFYYFPSIKYGIIITILILFLINFLIFLMAKNANLNNKFKNLFQFIKNKTVLTKIHSVFDKIITGYSSIKSFKQFVQVIILSVLLMLTYGFNALLGFWMINNFNLTYWDAYSVMSIGAIGIFIPTPGGFGSFHIITNSVLIQSYKFDLISASTYSFMMHIIGYLIQVIIGSIYFIQFHFQNRNITLDELLGIKRANQ